MAFHILRSTSFICDPTVASAFWPWLENMRAIEQEKLLLCTALPGRYEGFIPDSKNKAKSSMQNTGEASPVRISPDDARPQTTHKAPQGHRRHAEAAGSLVAASGRGLPGRAARPARIHACLPPIVLGPVPGLGGRLCCFGVLSCRGRYFDIPILDDLEKNTQTQHNYMAHGKAAHWCPAWTPSTSCAHAHKAHEVMHSEVNGGAIQQKRGCQGKCQKR